MSDPRATEVNVFYVNLEHIQVCGERLFKLATIRYIPESQGVILQAHSYSVFCLRIGHIQYGSVQYVVLLVWHQPPLHAGLFIIKHQALCNVVQHYDPLHLTGIGNHSDPLVVMVAIILLLRRPDPPQAEVATSQHLWCKILHVAAVVQR